MSMWVSLLMVVAVHLIVDLAAFSQNADAEQQPPDWWETQRDVVAMLLDQDTDIAELVEAVSAAPPKTGRQAMFKLSVLLRAGMNGEAIDSVAELKTLCPNLDNHQVGQIYYAACDGFPAWDVAQRVVEVFAGNISDLALENRLLKHWQSSGRSVDAIDRWLANMPPGRDGFWIKQRLRFNSVHGRAEPVIQEITERVKRDPQNIDTVTVFLDALIFARHTGKEAWDLTWMPEIVRPRPATQAEQVASRLKTLNQWQTASVFYQRAIDTPLTDEEVTELAMMRQAFVSPETLRAAFAAHTREGLAACLLGLGRNDEAQKWMVEAADIRQEHGLGLDALFAGQVQGASGQRVIEERIKDEREQSEDDPEYWRRRAQYYRGRSEPDLEEQALRRGLALTAPRSPAERPAKGRMDLRNWLLGDYARFLKRRNRIEESVALLRGEIERAPADAVSTVGAARLLAFDFPRHVHADDEVLWTSLGNRSRWEHVEQRLLWRMLENASPDKLDESFARAERLVKGKDPTRAYALGWIMNRMEYAKRSIPLLQYAVEAAGDDELGERAAFTLFESYLDSGHWRAAEEIFPQARGRLTPKEVPEWYARIARVAAAAGDKADAMRLWNAAANIDPSRLGGLRDLVKAGLRDELVAFYSDMAERLPSSEVPGKALKVLQGQ